MPATALVRSEGGLDPTPRRAERTRRHIGPEARRWLAATTPDVGRQGARIRVMERNIVLPVKAVILLLLTYYLFFAHWFDDVYTVREAVLLTVRTFFLIYFALNLVTGIFVVGMDELPLRLVREVVLAVALIDALFWGALVVVTNGFDSTLYWCFIGLIVRNAMSFPQASTQIVLNLIVSCCFVAAGLTEVAITQAEPELAEETTEPYVLRFVVLILITACCYGVQVLFDKQRRVEEEAREVAQPHERLGAARAQHLAVALAAEYLGVLGERVLDLVVAGQRGALGKPQLARRLALRRAPVVDAVLRDHARGDLGEARALVAVGAEPLAARGAARLVHPGRAACHQNSWLRTSCAVRPLCGTGTNVVSAGRGTDSA